MEDRFLSLSDEDLAEALRLGGWMLAHQALTAASGEIPMPLIAFAHDNLDSPKLFAPKTDSEFYNDQVIAGRVLTTDMGSQSRHWTFSYDTDLEDSGRALVVEVGVGKPLHRITFGQRYTYSDEAGLRLIGDLELVGRESLPSVVQERLESSRWRYFLNEGATNHDLAGSQWPAWYSARDNEQGICLPSSPGSAPARRGLTGTSAGKLFPRPGCGVIFCRDEDLRGNPSREL